MSEAIVQLEFDYRTLSASDRDYVKQTVFASQPR